MERIIKVSGVEVIQGRCLIAFDITILLGGGRLADTTSATHSTVYDLLDVADKVNTPEPSSDKVKVNLIAIASHGSIKIEIYKRNSNSF
jgi:hypothetical protein